MRTDKRIASIVGVVAGAVTLVAGSISFAAGGAIVAERVTADPVTMTAATQPEQTITAGCGPTCELWARAGSVTVGADVVPVWGFSTSDAGDLSLPGPTIVVHSGEEVSLTVHNELADDLDLDITGASAGDLTRSVAAITPGTPGVFTFTATQVGTSIYRAGASTKTGNRQLAMGLAGVLIVRPAECPAASGVDKCAYGDPSINAGNAGSAIGFDAGSDVFDDEALVVTNDLDPLFAADPLGYDITNFHPTLHLINGKAFPDTEVIDTQAGSNVLIRYANLGEADHSMGLSGMHQRTIGRDASALPHGSDDVVVPLNVGQTAEAMISVDPDAKAGFIYALADQARQPGLNNADPAMTFLTVWGDVAQPGKPSAEITTFSAPESAGDAAIDFDGVVAIPSGVADADKSIFTIDDPCLSDAACPSAGPVTLMPSPAPDGSTFVGTIPLATLAALSNGSHVLWVSVSNDTGATYGDAAGIAFTIDRQGPVVQQVAVDPQYTNGTGNVTVSATADSTLTGTGEVVSGTATIGACPALADQPTGDALTAVGPAPIAALSGAIASPASEGVYTVFVSAVDNRGVWSNDGAAGGAQVAVCGEGTLVVDMTAPVTSAGAVPLDPPSPNDGTQAYNGIQNFLEVVRINAHIHDDGLSGVAAAEGFLDVTEADGTGFRFTPYDGNFDSADEDVYADIPLASIRTLTPGVLHPIFVHGLDNAGNWEAFSATPMTSIQYNSGAPQISTLTFAAAGGEVGITGVSFGTDVTITDIKYFVDPAPMAAGDGTSVPAFAPAANVSAVLTGISVTGTNNIWVRALDSTGRWSAAVGLPTTHSLTITNNRRRINGTASATAIGGVTAVEFSTGAAAAPGGSGTNIQLTTTGVASVTFVYNKQGQAWAPNTNIWVRAQDAMGNWGPATLVVA